MTAPTTLICFFNGNPDGDVSTWVGKRSQQLRGQRRAVSAYGRDTGRSHDWRVSRVTARCSLAMWPTALPSITEQVNEPDAKTRLCELLERVERGEQITIARDGSPIARLIPAEPLTTRELSFVAGGPIADTFFEALPDDELSHRESA